MDIQNHSTREAWLMAGVERIKLIFEAQCHVVPPVRVSIGWPSAGQRSTHIGECWPSTRAADGVNQIFIVPSLSDAVQVLDVLTHELVHAVDDCETATARNSRRSRLAWAWWGRRCAVPALARRSRRGLRPSRQSWGPTRTGR